MSKITDSSKFEHSKFSLARLFKTLLSTNSLKYLCLTKMIIFFFTLQGISLGGFSVLVLHLVENLGAQIMFFLPPSFPQVWGKEKESHGQLNDTLLLESSCFYIFSMRGMNRGTQICQSVLFFG